MASVLSSRSVDFSGVIPILATPFRDDESLDLESMARLVRFMAEIGANGVTVLGVLGESNRLTDAEREQIVQTSVQAAESMPVIVGTSHAGTSATVSLSQMAESLGAAAVMVTPSHESVPSDDRIVDYYSHVAREITIPIVAQDHPASTQVHMSIALLARLVEAVPAIACLKEEGLPTPVRLTGLRKTMPREVPILTGLGALYGLFDLEHGSQGFNTGFAFPEVLLSMVNSARAGDWDAVRVTYARFLPLVVFEQQPGLAVRKEILRRRGLISHGHVRHPGANLTAEASDQLTRLLDWILPDTDLTRPLAL